MPVIDVFDRPIADWDVVMKWLFDKIVGGLALVALLPLMALVAIAIKLDSRVRCCSARSATASTTT